MKRAHRDSALLATTVAGTSMLFGWRECRRYLEARLPELRPKPKYAAFFIADRHERFGGEMVVIWLPGQDSNLQPIG